MEAFHFAVGLGPVGSDQFVSGADLRKSIGEGSAAAIGHGVVGHHPVYAIPNSRIRSTNNLRPNGVNFALQYPIEGLL